MPDALEISRNLWRHLQLEIISRSTRSGFTMLPLTPTSIERALAGWGVPANPVITQLREGYQSGLEGQSVDILPLVPQLMGMLQSLG